MATYKGVVPYGKYTFYPATQIIEFDNDYTGLALSDIMLITNVKSGTAITIYDPFDPAKGGTLAIVSGVITLTLNYNTTAMSNTDPLQIIVGMVNLPTALPTGAATETTLSSINTKTPSLGQALAAGSVPVVLTAAQLSTLTPLSSVSVSNFPATQSVSVTGSVAVTGPLTDAQLRASAVPVSLASLPALAAGSNTIGSINNISGTISLPTGAATAAKQPALGTAGTASADVITVQGIASMTALRVDGTGGTFPVSGSLTTVSTVTNLAQLGGTAIAMNSGVRTAGTQRVTIATDDVVQSKLYDGTNYAVIKGSSTAALATDPALVVAISPNNSISTGAAVSTSNPTYANGTTQALSLNTSGELRVGNDGTSVYRAVSQNSNNRVNIKDGAGKVYGWYIYNSNTVIKKVLLYDRALASPPTVGTVSATAPLFSLIIPANSGANVSFTNGVNFTNGLWIATVGGPTATTTLQDDDSTFVSTGDLSYNIIYK